MRTVTCTILITFFVLFAIYEVGAAIKMSWSNLTYKMLDPDVVRVLYCRLKPYKKNMQIASVRMKLLGLPLYNMSIGISGHKKYQSTYKLSLFNVEVDGCTFLRNPESNPIVYFFYDLLYKYSNVNHSCPYSGDIIIQNMPLDLSKINKFPIPLPAGDYAVYFTVKTFGVARVLINSYFKAEQA